MISFTPTGRLSVYGEKLSFEVQPITEEQAREILEAVYAKARSQCADAPTVDEMIAADRTWYVGDVLGTPKVHLYWGVWNTPALTRVIILSVANPPLVT